LQQSPIAAINLPKMKLPQETRQEEIPARASRGIFRRAQYVPRNAESAGQRRRAVNQAQG